MNWDRKRGRLYASVAEYLFCRFINNHTNRLGTYFNEILMEKYTTLSKIFIPLNISSDSFLT